PGKEGGGDNQGGPVRVLHDVGRGGGIPGGVSSGLEGGAQAAGREGRGIRLTLDEFLAGELGQGAAVAVGGDEAVVLLGGDAGHGLEQVGEVGGAFFDGPIAHGGGNGVGGGGIQGRALLDGLLEGFEDRLGETLALNLFVEDVHAEEVFDVGL